jgi:methylenetetrahydrofolate dehydrogenase (NADP+)/methenyltetrahydrofolate cyclohydrolase
MAAIHLDGRALARDLRQELHQESQSFQSRMGRAAHLALFIAGEDTGATIFGQQVLHACRTIGVATSLTSFDSLVSEVAVRARVAQASDDPTTDGIVILLPLPGTIRQRVITEVIAPSKDVDGLGPRNAGNLLLGYSGFVPGTSEAMLVLLQHANIPLRGKHVVIIGRSHFGGKPAAFQFLRQDATVTICHSHTKELAEITRTADILFVSIGRPYTITSDMVRPGAVVLDAGINRTSHGLVGDVDPAVESVAGWITPVPGGLGPLTHLMVIRHTLMGPTGCATR